MRNLLRTNYTNLARFSTVFNKGICIAYLHDYSLQMNMNIFGAGSLVTCKNLSYMTLLIKTVTECIDHFLVISLDLSLSLSLALYGYRVINAERHLVRHNILQRSHSSACVAACIIELRGTNASLPEIE